MCSCHRDGKAKHTEACQAAHRRYNRSPGKTRSRARSILRRLGVAK